MRLPRSLCICPPPNGCLLVLRSCQHELSCYEHVCLPCVRWCAVASLGLRGSGIEESVVVGLDSRVDMMPGPFPESGHRFLPLPAMYKSHYGDSSSPSCSIVRVSTIDKKKGRKEHPLCPYFTYSFSDHQWCSTFLPTSSGNLCPVICPSLVTAFPYFSLDLFVSSFPADL